CYHTASTTLLYTLSLHDALPIFVYTDASMTGIRSSRQGSSERPDEYANFERALKKVLSVSHSEIKVRLDAAKKARQSGKRASGRSEEHTSELQSRENLVCRLLLE